MYTKDEVNQIVSQSIQEFKSSNDVYTKAEVDQMIKQVEKDAQYNSLKAKAAGNKLNLVLTGLPEDENKTTYDLAKDFIENVLKIKDAGIDVAYRLGTAPDQGSSYARPVIIRFIRVHHRNRVWKK